MPSMIAVKSAVGIPLKRTDGEVLWRSQGPVRLSQGKGTVAVPLRTQDDIEHMRLFFENDADYNLVRFIHPLYGRD